jgi:hypothetical protein
MIADIDHGGAPRGGSEPGAWSASSSRRGGLEVNLLGKWRYNPAALVALARKWDHEFESSFLQLEAGSRVIGDLAQADAAGAEARRRTTGRIGRPVVPPDPGR